MTVAGGEGTVPFPSIVSFNKHLQAAGWDLKSRPSSQTGPSPGFPGALNAEEGTARPPEVHLSSRLLGPSGSQLPTLNKIFAEAGGNADSGSPKLIRVVLLWKKNTK